MSHDHGRHDHHGPGAGERRLTIALAVLLAFTIAEAVGAWLSNSIALFAEAGHMLADCGSFVLAIVAIRVARRPGSAVHTFGHARYQTLAAFVNGLALMALTAWVATEALIRLAAPPPVHGELMLGVAVLGALANLAEFVTLSGTASLNERGARAHVASDLLGAIAAGIAALVILELGWLPADPVLSLAASLLILRSAWRLIRDSAHVLLEAAPSGANAEHVAEQLRDVPGLAGVHHVHAWSLTGEAALVTLHAELAPAADSDATLREIRRRLRGALGVRHATVQLEHATCRDAGCAA